MNLRFLPGYVFVAAAIGCVSTVTWLVLLVSDWLVRLSGSVVGLWLAWLAWDVASSIRRERRVARSQIVVTFIRRDV